MRISSILQDNGFRTDIWKFDVFLDGEKVNNLVTADEEGGFVIMTIQTNGKIAYIEKSGKVQIRLGRAYIQY